MTQQQETVTKQKNPLRIEQEKKLIEYNKRKKEKLKRLNEQITKQDNIAEHKPRPDTSTYVYAGGLSVLGLAIGGYLLYSKFKKQKRNLIDVPLPPVPKTRGTFQILGGSRGRRTGVGVTTVSNSLILGGWVTNVFKNGDKNKGG